MKEHTWHKGPPPHVGWWEASIAFNAMEWRWWDGEDWSWPAFPSTPLADVVIRAKKHSDQHDIRWTDYWPADARVPRLDPTDGHWTFNTTGKQPQVEGFVELWFRGDAPYRTRSLEGWYWPLSGHSYDIVAWRKAKQEQTP